MKRAALWRQRSSKDTGFDGRDKLQCGRYGKGRTNPVTSAMVEYPKSYKGYHEAKDYVHVSPSQLD